MKVFRYMAKEEPIYSPRLPVEENKLSRNFILTKFIEELIPFCVRTFFDKNLLPQTLIYKVEAPINGLVCPSGLFSLSFFVCSRDRLSNVEFLYNGVDGRILGELRPYHPLATNDPNGLFSFSTARVVVKRV